MTKDKFYFMRLALREAAKAGECDEVPVGAVAVKDGKVIARAHNRKERALDATEHAEMRVMKKAAKRLCNWWLEGVDIYVTLEPCAMCAGAMINARIGRLFFGAWEPKSGCAGSVYSFLTDGKLNHTVQTEGGILADDSAALLSTFFKRKRR